MKKLFGVLFAAVAACGLFTTAASAQQIDTPNKLREGPTTPPTPSPSPVPTTGDADTDGTLWP